MQVWKLKQEGTQAEKAFIQPTAFLLPDARQFGVFLFFWLLLLLLLFFQQYFGGVKISWQHSGHMLDSKTKGSCSLAAPEADLPNPWTSGKPTPWVLQQKGHTTNSPRSLSYSNRQSLGRV